MVEDKKQEKVIKCPVCGYENFFNNPVLQQIGLVICGSPSCGVAYCPVVDRLVENQKRQAEGAETAETLDRAKAEGSMSSEEFEKIREKNKDLIIKP